MALKVVTPPAEEPVSLSEARDHLRITHTAEDTLIDTLIVVAREVAEVQTGRALVTTDLRLSLGGFPAGGEPIQVPRPRLQSVTLIRYVDPDGAEQVFDPSAYLVDTEEEPGQIFPAPGRGWPATRAQPGAVRVDYTAGYGAAAAVPRSIKQACLLLVGHLYSNPAALSADPAAIPLPMGVEMLLTQNRVWWGFS